MVQKTEKKASEIYFKPRDRFYFFLEQHETMNKERRKQERKGAVYMTIFFCLLVTLAFITHENPEFNLINRIFVG